MPDIHVFVIDASRTSRQLTKSILAADPRFTLVGAAGSLGEAKQVLHDLDVQVVVIDASIPDAELPKAIWQITSAHRDVGVVVVGRNSDTDTLRRYILAGARGFVPRPLSADELRQTVQDVYDHLASERTARETQQTPATGPLVVRRSGELGHVVVVFGAKGGVGKTTVTANLGAALSQLTDKRVGIVDADFAFGDIGLLFDLTPANTILDFVAYLDHSAGDEIDREYLKSIMARHAATGIRVLLSSTRPERADMITPHHVHLLLAELPRLFDFVLLDCPVAYDERTLLILEHADQLLFVVTPDVGALSNTRRFLNVAEALGFESERINIVFNRADSQVGITARDVQKWLAFPVSYTLASGGPDVVRAANRGTPLVLRSPRHKVSRNVISIARDVITNAEETRAQKHTGMLRAPKTRL